MRACVSRAAFLTPIVLGLCAATVSGQELDMKQTTAHDFSTEIVSIPISVVKGVGIFSDIELQLSFVNGTFSLLDYRPVVEFARSYALRTATAPSRCLEGNSTSNESFLGQCSNVTGMAWKFVEKSGSVNEDTFFWLQNLHTQNLGVCLTDNVVGGSRRVSMEICDSANRNQLWKILPSANGFYNIVPKPSQGVQECLDGAAATSGAPAVAPCNNTSNQMWIINNYGENPGFIGRWNTTYGPMMISQVGNNITGTYREGDPFSRRVTGVVSQVTANSFRVDGTWTADSASGPFVWIVSEDNSHWRGNFGGVEWCGWRDDAMQPNPCLLIP